MHQTSPHHRGNSISQYVIVLGVISVGAIATLTILGGNTAALYDGQGLQQQAMPLVALIQPKNGTSQTAPPANGGNPPAVVTFPPNPGPAGGIYTFNNVEGLTLGTVTTSAQGLENLADVLAAMAQNSSAKLPEGFDPAHLNNLADDARRIAKDILTTRDGILDSIPNNGVTSLSAMESSVEQFFTSFSEFQSAIEQPQFGTEGAELLHDVSTYSAVVKKAANDAGTFYNGEVGLPKNWKWKAYKPKDDSGLPDIQTATMSVDVASGVIDVQADYIENTGT